MIKKSALLFLTAATMAATTLTLDGVPSLSDPEGNYVGPYSIQVDSQNSIDAFCITAWKEVFLNETWTATAFTNLTGSGYTQAQLNTSEAIATLILDFNADPVAGQDDIWNQLDPGYTPVTAAMQSILTQAAGVTVDPERWEVFVSPDAQDFIAPLAVNAAGTPEPSGLIMMTIGLLLIAGRRWGQSSAERE